MDSSSQFRRSKLRTFTSNLASNSSGAGLSGNFSTRSVSSHHSTPFKSLIRTNSENRIAGDVSPVIGSRLRFYLKNTVDRETNAKGLLRPIKFIDLVRSFLMLDTTILLGFLIGSLSAFEVIEEDALASNFNGLITAALVSTVLGLSCGMYVTISVIIIESKTTSSTRKRTNLGYFLLACFGFEVLATILFDVSIKQTTLDFIPSSLAHARLMCLLSCISCSVAIILLITDYVNSIENNFCSAWCARTCGRPVSMGGIDNRMSNTNFNREQRSPSMDSKSRSAPPPLSRGGFAIRTPASILGKEENKDVLNNNNNNNNNNTVDDDDDDEGNFDGLGELVSKNSQIKRAGSRSSDLARNPQKQEEFEKVEKRRRRISEGGIARSPVLRPFIRLFKPKSSGVSRQDAADEQQSLDDVESMISTADDQPGDLELLNAMDLLYFPRNKRYLGAIAGITSSLSAAFAIASPWALNINYEYSVSALFTFLVIISDLFATLILCFSLMATVHLKSGSLLHWTASFAASISSIVAVSMLTVDGSFGTSPNDFATSVLTGSTILAILATISGFVLYRFLVMRMAAVHLVLARTKEFSSTAEILAREYNYLKGNRSTNEINQAAFAAAKDVDPCNMMNWCLCCSSKRATESFAYSSEYQLRKLKLELERIALEELKVSREKKALESTTAQEISLS